MMGKILPILLVILGVVGGGAAGFVMRPSPPPPPPEEAEADSTQDEMPKEKAAKELPEGEAPAFVKMNNQFIVPIVAAENVSALVVLSLTLETSTDATESLYNLEPKIRDTALRVLFDHAYAGGFDGHFTAPTKLDTLRRSLIEAINPIAGGTVSDVLITDIVRQDK